MDLRDDRVAWFIHDPPADSDLPAAAACDRPNRASTKLNIVLDPSTEDNGPAPRPVMTLALLPDWSKFELHD